MTLFLSDKLSCCSCVWQRREETVVAKEFQKNFPCFFWFPPAEKKRALFYEKHRSRGKAINSKEGCAKIVAAGHSMEILVDVWHRFPLASLWCVSWLILTSQRSSFLHVSFRSLTSVHCSRCYFLSICSEKLPHHGSKRINCSFFSLRVSGLRCINFQNKAVSLSAVLQLVHGCSPHQNNLLCGWKEAVLQREGDAWSPGCTQGTPHGSCCSCGSHL